MGKSEWITIQLPEKFTLCILGCNIFPSSNKTVLKQNSLTFKPAVVTFMYT